MLEEILQPEPSRPIAVFVVWFEVLGAGDRAIDTSLIADPRVTQYWDEEGLITAFFTEHSGQLGLPNDLLWDAYLLFGPNVAWDEIPEPLTGFGATVINTINDLKIQLDQLG